MMAAGGRSAAGPGEWGALAPCFGALLCRYRCRRCLMRQALAFCFHSVPRSGHENPVADLAMLKG